jgi:hypothetical protein
MQGFFTQARFIFCGFLAMAVLATGCATSKYGDQITKVDAYPQCYAPIQELRDADSDFNKTMAIATGIGVLGGAMIGLMTTGKVQGALIGAAAGGVAGAGVGYVKAKQERIADDNQRMASYLADLEGDISGLDRATAAARTARDCYNRQFKQAVADYKAGLMPRRELAGRYEEIKNGCTEADAILGTAIAAADDKERAYQEALESESQRAGVPVPAVAAAPAQPSGAKASARRAHSRAKAGAERTGAGTGAKSGATADPAQADKAVTQKTSAPLPGDTSLDAMAQNMARLNESQADMLAEQVANQESMRQMDAEMALLEAARS